MISANVVRIRFSTYELNLAKNRNFCKNHHKSRNIDICDNSIDDALQAFNFDEMYEKKNNVGFFFHVI